MTNAWLAHLKQFRKQNPGLQFKELLQQARKSYQGGEPVAADVKNLASRSAKVGGEPVAADVKNLASRSAKVGGEPVSADVKNLASRSAKFGGSRRKSRRRQTRKSRRR
jgi:hypothetical protein